MILKNTYRSYVQMVFVKNKPGACSGVCQVLQYINSLNNDSNRKQQGFKLVLFPLFEEDISLPAVTMETKLY